MSILVVGSLGIWLHLFFILKKSFNFSPSISKSNPINVKNILVSIIIPARNEEKFIQMCLSSLLNQHYNNYEIIIVDDNSTDKTLEITRSLKRKNDKIRIIEAGEKPEGWIGKNWPCYVGYQQSKGRYLLFTDADTIHSNRGIGDSLFTLLDEKLDVLTAVPNLIYPTFMVKMVLPILSIFMFSRYSPMRVNDPKIKLGYLFGSFFIISRTIYEKIGTHESVKSEIVEDGALGKKIKESGYRLKMFRGEDILSAYWARDFHSLWNSLKRLIIPMYFTDKKNSILLTIGIFILMVFPFIALVYSFFEISTKKNINDFSLLLLFAFSIIAVLSIYLTNYYQLKKAKTHNVLYFFGTPIGCFIISLSFLWSIISSEKKGVIKWKDRIYHYNKL
ncbi:MAG: glycosyltransferase [Nitrosopumilus sp.]|nr:glycosyltransferase [Nitrosopumilus sp.]